MPSSEQTDEPKREGEASFRSDELLRIARELHEATSQLLVSLEAQLEPLKQLHHPGAKEVVRDCGQAVDEIPNEVAALNRKNGERA